MSNNKNFLLKNAVEVSGPTKTTVGTVTSNDVDLSTGNYFVDAPTGVSTYTFSNPADVQAFQMEITGGTAEVAQNFSTTLYTGNGTSQTITNDIDLSGDGGLVWIKDRDAGNGHNFYDTERGATKRIASNLTSAETTRTDGLTSFNANGFSGGNDASINTNGNDYASWTFKKEPSFFDVVTWTGDGTARTLSHSLNSTVGCYIVKSTSLSSDWVVYHRGIDATSPEDFFLELNNSNARFNFTYWNDTAPTTTEFNVGPYNDTNANGETYVAYLFAHDTDADGLIQCGSYTGNGSTDGPEINLGWEPQWLLIKNTTTAGEQWLMVDTARGLATGESPKRLWANTNDAEATAAFAAMDLLSTGFKPVTTDATTNKSGDNYIYIAIRAASDLDITWPTSIEWTGGAAPSAPATGETDLYTFVTDDSGTSYTGIKSADNLS
jgi:hypothetical protein